MSKLNMDKRSFYRDRILWRASQHSLPDGNCLLYSELVDSDREFAENILDDDVDPVIVFWGGRNLWTVLGTNKVCSFHDGCLTCKEVDKIEKNVEIYTENEGVSSEHKRHSSFILVGGENKIWAPAGRMVFALMSILLMFPLRGAVDKI